MSIIKYDPINEFDAITRRFESFLNNFQPTLETRRANQHMFSPKVDIHEDEKNLYFDLELPGMKRNQVKISVNDDHYLIIQGEKQSERHFEGDKEITGKHKNGNGKTSEEEKAKSKTLPHRIERSYGSFVRSFTLPENADIAHINAALVHGVLEVRVPKIEGAKPKHLEVNIN